MTTQTLRKQSARLISLEGKSCEDCGEEKKEGKQNLTRHHFEDKPETVAILCRKCHAKEHKKNGSWGIRPKKYILAAEVVRKENNMEEKVIAINCRGTSEFPLEELEDFQGGLKSISEEELNKLKYSILTEGFAFPVFIWEGHKKILDGHQRLKALDNLLKEGYTIDKPIPCVDIPAKDEKEAKKKLLLISSRYGKVTEEGLRAFVVDIDLDIPDLKLSIDMPEIDLDIMFPTSDSQTPDTFEKEKSNEKRLMTCPECGYEF